MIFVSLEICPTASFSLATASPATKPTYFFILHPSAGETDNKGIVSSSRKISSADGRDFSSFIFASRGILGF
jgi:hypothetical protein